MKVPEPKKLPSGNWNIMLRLGGQNISITRPTARECKRIAELTKAEYRNGKRNSGKSKNGLTLGEAIDKYIEKYEKVLSPATIRGYTSIRRNRFQNIMGMPISNITNWQTVINNELKTKSEHTVKNGWGLITAAIGDAGLPVPNVKLAKVPVNDLPFLEPEEIPLFLKAAEGDTAEIEMLLELHGLRESEAMYVVRNNAIDIEKNLIYVNGAVVPNKDHKYVEKRTNKTRSSTRTVPIMIPRLADLVRQHYESGIPLRSHSPSALLSHVHKTCQRAGITDVTNHGLRHTFASLAYSLGLSERATMDLGGWQDIQTMHKIYIRLTARDKSKSENAITEFFRNANKNADENADDGSESQV